MNRLPIDKEWRVEENAKYRWVWSNSKEVDDVTDACPMCDADWGELVDKFDQCLLCCIAGETHIVEWRRSTDPYPEYL